MATSSRSALPASGRGLLAAGAPRRTSISLGRTTLTVDLEELPQENGDAVRTLNYGGGARWFLNKHVAFTFDVRFYSIGVDSRCAPAARSH